MNQGPSESAKRNYWHKNLQWLGGLLLGWFLISLGCGVLLADWLDQFRVPGSDVRLGFWIGQQGSMIGFVILIAIYAAVMNRLDRELLRGTHGEGREES